MDTPGTGKKLALRPFGDDDAPLLHHWLAAPHVRPWFEHPAHWMREVRLRRTEYSWIRHFLALWKDAPAGFCQYDAYERSGETWQGAIPLAETYSIDYLVGDGNLLRQGLGTAMVLALLQRLRKLLDAPLVSRRLEDRLVFPATRLSRPSPVAPFFIF